MYVYHPKFQKKKEKLVAWFLVALGVILYITSQYPGAPIPGVWQILGVCSLAGSILIISMCILRSYSYELVDGVLTIYSGRSDNYASGDVRLLVNQYDANGDLLAAGTIDLYKIVK